MPRIYATCPQSKDVDRSAYLTAVADVARWSEQAGCIGILVYTDDGIVDPWLVSQVVIEAAERLCPLVAVQPVYLHPYWMAKMVASIAFLHGRAVHLNMLAGSFRNDLLALGDSTPHDERYVSRSRRPRGVAGPTDFGRRRSVMADGCRAMTERHGRNGRSWLRSDRFHRFV